MDEREKLKRFASDQRMMGAVYHVLLAAFLEKDKGADVHQLAASRIAIDRLQDAWKKLEAYKHDEEEVPQRAATHV